ncbi:pteridine reductase [Methyloterricola oryzae]|uniref:pteridine reductase n=1 Tax=Methyloterricola oryzae TaxID=1495050 RepID=UPI001F359BE4|nr:pteridine reductase [Methyloterricola oryzae]
MIEPGPAGGEAPVALITGAGRRLGACMARRFHGAGCNVVLHVRNSGPEAAAMAAELNGLRASSALVCQADLLDLSALGNVANEAAGAWGRLDVLVNNASSFYPTPLENVTEGQWEELMGSNLKAPFFLCQAAAPFLRARRGSVVNLIDIHAERGLKGYPVYSIAKAGLAAMTRSLAKELAPDIRVNGVAPGAVLWPEHDMDVAKQAEILSRIPLQRTGEPEDVARAALFLAFEAPYVTGQILSVDGGRSLFS